MNLVESVQDPRNYIDPASGTEKGSVRAGSFVWDSRILVPWTHFRLRRYV